MPSQRVTVERILCPTDFSEFSERALSRAVRLGHWFRAPITVFHAIPLISSTMAGPMGGGYVSIPEELLINERRDAEEAMKRFVAPHLDADVPIETRVLEGEPCRLIEAMAAELPADLVVMGTHGRGGWDRLLLGSTTEKVVRRLICPVLTIGKQDAPTADPLFHRILCAVDLAHGCERTVDLALRLAQENRARLILLNVVESRLREIAAPPHRAARDHASLARRVLDARLQHLRDLGKDARAFCDVAERVERGTPWREIVRVADDLCADLIVVGPHVRGFRRAFLGSTTNQVMRHAKCPVLVMRDGPQDGPTTILKSPAHRADTGPSPSLLELKALGNPQRDS